MTGLEALNILARNVESLEIDTFYECKGAYQFLEKSLKALEIIKEKRVNVGMFIHLTKVLKKDYEQCKALNNTFGANICDTEKDFLTEEEFNTLKAVLE